MSKNNILFWFRQDLRITDNPALNEASKQGNVFPIYILDDHNPKDFKMGSASRCWLHYSLQDLDRNLKNNLNYFMGNPQDIILDLVKKHSIDSVIWNRCYEPWQVSRDKKIKMKLKSINVNVKTFNGSLLWEPWDILKKDGTPYKVFTPFYKKGCQSLPSPKVPLNKPYKLETKRIPFNNTTVKSLNLLPKHSWHEKIKDSWSFGEANAKKRLQAFLRSGIHDYKEGRNYPNKNNVSLLSSHIHFGEISPNQIWHSVNKFSNINSDHFLSELGWREFSYNLLFHFPDLPNKNLQPKFNKFKWNKSNKLLKSWQQGKTGYPLIDAGMRELWQTGYMHNRIRMVVASFLVKNLLLHWKHGEKWFWDCLVDADLANNCASWQWVAGCGADAAPYFRIFNPVLQSKKFDADAFYIRKWVPEIAKLPTKFIHSPWEASELELAASGVKLGKTYPFPIVDLKSSRDAALKAYNML